MALELVHDESYDHYMARMAAIVREAKYQASLPKHVTIPVENEESFLELLHCYAKGEALFTCLDALTLIGLYLEAQGNPAFAGFKDTAYPLSLPPGYKVPQY